MMIYNKIILIHTAGIQHYNVSWNCQWQTKCVFLYDFKGTAEVKGRNTVSWFGDWGGWGGHLSECGTEATGVSGKSHTEEQQDLTDRWSHS